MVQSPRVVRVFGDNDALGIRNARESVRYTFSFGPITFDQYRRRALLRGGRSLQGRNHGPFARWPDRRGSLHIGSTSNSLYDIDRLHAGNPFGASKAASRHGDSSCISAKSGRSDHTQRSCWTATSTWRWLAFEMRHTRASRMEACSEPTPNPWDGAARRIIDQSRGAIVGFFDRHLLEFGRKREVSRNCGSRLRCGDGGLVSFTHVCVTLAKNRPNW